MRATRETPADIGVGYTPPMTGRRKKGTGSGRYDERLIAARVEARRRVRRVEVKQICAELGMEKWDWSRKVRNDRSSFSIAELSRIAELLEGPTGWPFVDEQIGELLDLRATRTRRGPKRNPPESR